MSDYGGEKEAARLRRYGYPSGDELSLGRMIDAHERGEHVGKPEAGCYVCRYFRRTRRA